MAKQELEIVITPSGDVQINVNGIKGDKCLDLTKSLEQALGDTVQRTMKPEYYESGTNTNIAVQQNRQPGNFH